MTLKTTYQIVTSLLQSIITSQEKRDLKLKLIQEVKLNDMQAYNQIVLLHLRQTSEPTQKMQLRNLISEINGEESLIQQDGDLDFSILGALGNNKKQVKMNALSALCTPAGLKQLSNNEASLVELFLSQIIQRG